MDSAITKTNINDTVEWSMQYDEAPVIHAFDVAPDESYLWFCKTWGNRIKISQINTTDGSLIKSFKSKSDGTGNWISAKMDTSYSSLVISEDSTTVYISASNSTDVSRYHCRWIPSSTDDKIRCGTNQLDSDNNTYRMVNSINAVNENVSYITLEEINQLYLEVRKIDYSVVSNYVLWTTRVSWDGNTWNTVHNKLLLDHTNNRIYTSVIIGETLGFFVLNMTDGNQVSGTSIFLLNTTCSSRIVYKMHLYDNKVYIPAQWSLPVLHIYDVSNDIFLDSYIASK